MDERSTVLVFPCGSEVGSEIYESLRYSVHVRLVGASSVDDHGRYRFGIYAGGLPRVDEPGFVEAFARVVEDHGVDLIFATHDTVAERLAAAGVGGRAVVVNGDRETAALCRSKIATYRHFRSRSWVPTTYADVDDVDTWPVVVKPDRGQGGQGITLAHDAVAARAAARLVPEPVLVEYLPGAEITVDCFTDRHGVLIVAAARTRERVRSGISMRSFHLPPDDEIAQIAGSVNAGLRFRGPWFLQLKRDTFGRWKLLEVAARLAASAAAQRARGLNLPLMTVLDHRDRDVVALPLEGVRGIDRRLLSVAELDVEFDAVFIDLDDTILQDGLVVPIAVGFLYQMIAEGKRIVLLTRHSGDVSRTLDAARLSPGVFDEVVHLRSGEPKADYVTARSIFVDNHFPERSEVHHRHHVPVFDVDALHFLLR